VEKTGRKSEGSGKKRGDGRGEGGMTISQHENCYLKLLVEQERVGGYADF